MTSHVRYLIQRGLLKMECWKYVSFGFGFPSYGRGLGTNGVGQTRIIIGSILLMQAV